MVTGKQIKVGMIIIFQGDLWKVLSTQIIAPGNWRAFTQTKLRNLAKGTLMEHRFRADETVERAMLDQQSVEFLYQDGDQFHFMNMQNYEQFHLSREDLGDNIKFLTPNMKMQVQSYNGKPIGVDPPKTVKLKVIETDPFLKTATVTNSYKNAKVETGATFQVPGFIQEGEIIEIDTESSDYIGRAKE